MIEKCISNILSGPWRLIQLRGDLISAADINRGDIDFLASEESINALTAEAYTWVKKGYCHAHIGARKFGKKMLTLYSRDGLKSLRLDLWYVLPQLFGTKVPLTYEALQAAAENNDDLSICRIKVDIEASIYLHHLALKNKDLSLNYIHQRLEDYLGRCSETLVLEALQRTVENGQVNKQDLQKTLTLILAALPPKQTPLRNNCRKRLQGGRNMLCIMGCDGVGKTSLVMALAKRTSPPAKSFRGKRLYRLSMLYKISLLLLHPIFPNRDLFDERFSGLIYLRACLGLTLKKLSNRKKIMIYDRSLADFLCLHRQTDKPRWSKFYPVSNFLGQRTPTIHCIASYETIQGRKQEITAAGHRLYDQMMFEHFSRQCPTEYTIFNNDNSFETSLKTLKNIISNPGYPFDINFKT